MTLSKLRPLQTKAFDNRTTVLHYLVKVMRRTNKDVLKFKDDIKSVFLAKGVVMERLLSVVKQLCEDAKIVTETAAKDGDRLRASPKISSNLYKLPDLKGSQASMKELRQLKVFLSETDIPAGKRDWTHFEVSYVNRYAHTSSQFYCYSHKSELSASSLLSFLLHACRGLHHFPN